MSRKADTTDTIEQVREEIAEMSEHLRVMFEHAPIGVTVFDENFKYIDCNEAVLKMYGVTREVYSTFFGSESHSPEFQPDGRRSSEKAMEVIKRVIDGETVKIEWTHCTPDGQPLPVELTMVRVTRDGKYVGLGYIYDMREQIRQKEELEAARKVEIEANERFKVMINLSPLICNLWTKDGRIFDCNEAALKLFGIKDKETYYKRFLEFAPEMQPEGQSTVDLAREKLDEVFKTGSCKFKYIAQKPDGTIIPQEVVMARVRYKGQYIAVGYGRDLREEERVISILENRDKDLQSILNMLPIGVRILRLRDTALVYANEASLKVFNCETFEQVAYRNGLDFMPEFQPDGRKTVDVVGELFQYDNVTAEVHCLKLGGEPFIARFTSCMVEYQGEPSSLSTVEDVTAEIEQQQMLHNIALMEREANQAKSAFLSSMSHEIRTPINAIVGMTAIGKKADSVDGKNHALSKIEDASSHLLGIVNDVLDMAKIEADKLELSPMDFDFRRMLLKVVTVVHFRMEEKHLQLIVNIDDNVPHYMVGDDQRLAQVLANLLSNAVKFTNVGGIVYLDATISKETDEYYELRVEVTDSGIGMSSEQQEKLFDAFEQADKGTSRKYGGTGLGLAISKRIVEMMGGRIWVESELGEGARFVFTVKVARSDRKDIPVKYDGIGSKGEPGAVDKSTFKDKRLLVVEDIEINRDIVRALLEDTGIKIDCAENGKAALDIVTANPGKYDIIFMDLQMPQMGGLEATRRIRDHLEDCGMPTHPGSRLPIIAMTADVFREDIETCFEAGMDDHLGKPLDLDKIMDVLLKHLRK